MVSAQAVISIVVIIVVIMFYSLFKRIHFIRDWQTAPYSVETLKCEDFLTGGMVKEPGAGQLDIGGLREHFSNTQKISRRERR